MTRASALDGLRGRKDLGPHPTFSGPSAVAHAAHERDLILVGEGVDTPAHIDAMTSTGNTDKPGGTEYMITLTVKPASGEPYEVTTNQYIYPSAPFNEGDDVTVKVDPSDPNVVMIFGKS